MTYKTDGWRLGCHMSSIEFRPDGEAVSIDDSYHEVPSSRHPRRRLLTNGRHCIEVIAPGKKRNRWLAEYERQQLLKPVAVIASEPFRKTVEQEVVAPAVVVVPKPVPTPAAPAVVEQAEAEEFLEAVTERELYVPSPDEWFEARVVASRNPKILLELTTGDQVSCLADVVTVSPGSHVLCLPIDTVGSLRMELVNDHYRALEYRVDGDPAQMDETAKVIRWNPQRTFGTARRPCGCQIFIAYTIDENIFGVIHVGDWIRYELRRDRSKDGWVGVEARKIEAPQTVQGSEVKCTDQE